MAAKNDGEKLWVVIGDIHGEMDNFAKIPEISDADGIIVSGDLTNLGGEEAAKKVMDEIGSTGLPVFAQIGNMDKPVVNDWLTSQGNNLHGKVIALTPDIAIFGIGGSTPTPFNTPSEFSEEMIAGWLEDEWKKAEEFPHKIFISHNPPKNTACDDIGKGIHVGSESVRRFIEEKQPDVCVCGHIHEGRAREKIGETIVINPGALADGGYVVLRERNGAIDAELGTVKD